MTTTPPNDAGTTSNDTTVLPENVADASAQSVPPAQPVPPAPPAQPGSSVQAAPAPAHKLSTFLKVSIILLAGLSVAAISLVFIGDFEGKFERVFATFIIFAIFVVLTAIDTSRDLRSNWYAPVALIANSYILAISLIVVWMSPYDFWLGWDIFWKVLVVLAVTRAVVGCCQLLIGMGDGKPEALGTFTFITSALAVISGILFTAPVAIETFPIMIPELYWKIAVAALLLTALGLAITLLLRWSYGAQDREAKRNARQAYAQAQAQAHAQAQAQVAAPAPAAPSGPVAPATSAESVAPAAADGEQPLLPWPTFPDGRPLPIGPDGQPDFSALNR